jgi:hypothetical protein
LLVVRLRESRTARRSRPRSDRREGPARAAYDVVVTEACSVVSQGATLTVVCPADWNGSGTVNSQDFFDFLAAFFAGDPSADFNSDGVVNSQDFFDFLTAFFAGC